MPSIYKVKDGKRAAQTYEGFTRYTGKTCFAAVAWVEGEASWWTLDSLDEAVVEELLRYYRTEWGEQTPEITLYAMEGVVNPK